jgi:hypothetical protein
MGQAGGWVRAWGSFSASRRPDVALSPPSETIWVQELSRSTLPEGWSEHQDAEGKTYYHNKATGTSTYERPAGRDRDPQPGRVKHTLSLTGLVLLPFLVALLATAVVKSAVRKPVPGTPWVVVRTKDAKILYYNTATKKSVWKLPVELQGKPLPSLETSPEPEAQEGAEDAESGGKSTIIPILRKGMVCPPLLSDEERSFLYPHETVASWGPHWPDPLCILPHR